MVEQLASGGVALAGSLLNNMINADNASQANEWNKEAADKAYQRQVSMWNMQNEYNNPSNQVSRLLAAGLNPHAIYGNINNSPSAIPSVSPGSSAISAQFGLDTRSVLDSVMAAKTAQKIDADISNVNADTAKKEVEKKLTEANITKTENESATQLYQLQQILPAQLKELNRKIEAMDLDSFLKEIQGNDAHLLNELQRKMLDANYRDFINNEKIRHEILLGDLENTRKTGKLIAAQTYKTNQEGRVAQAAADFAVSTAKVRQDALEIANKIGLQDYALKCFQLIDQQKWSELNEEMMRFQQDIEKKKLKLSERSQELEERKQNYVEKRDQINDEFRKKELEVKQGAFVISAITSLAHIFQGGAQAMGSSDYQTTQLLLGM